MNRCKVSRLLVANRGEIACRIIRTAKKYGVHTIAVYTDEEADALHVRMADEKIRLKPSISRLPYLEVNAIMKAAAESRADAIHPGYGFLSENPDLARACKENSVRFIGPDEETLRFNGNKIEARNRAVSLGIPVVPSVTGTADDLEGRTSLLRYPVIIKAAAGGGGKGMKVVDSPESLREAIESASREAQAYFGNDTLFVEEYIADPKHIEVQVFGDGKGNVIHLWERECTIQRRYQKIIEEAPSPSLDESLRANITEMAVRFAASGNYRSAGTVEFIMTPRREIYFLEMNTRIQVEHPVTEEITGLDLVQMQLELEESGELPVLQEAVRISGWAMEARVYAEDPFRNFLPSPGNLSLFLPPSGKYIRVESGYDRPGLVSEKYDPLIAKLISWGPDREQARIRMTEALQEFTLAGIPVNLEYLRILLEHESFMNGSHTTAFIGQTMEEVKKQWSKEKESIPSWLPAVAYFSSRFLAFPQWRPALYQANLLVDGQPAQLRFSSIGGTPEFEINGRIYSPWVEWQEPFGRFTLPEGSWRYACSDPSVLPAEILLNGMHFTLQSGSREVVLTRTSSQVKPDEKQLLLKAPIHGKIVKLNKREGEQVSKGETILVMEAMKMENNIIAESDGRLEEIRVNPGLQVKKDQLLGIMVI